MRIVCTVSNDLSYDQRMQRIAATLAEAGHEVTLVGRQLPHSIPLEHQPFAQKRLYCRCNKGFLFYAELNIRLFWLLLFLPFDAVCSVDLDTLPAGCAAGLLRRKKRVFDAHEYFTEVPEVVNRPLVKAFWELVARTFLPFYRHAYTVGPELARIFEQRYRIAFGVVRNMPLHSETPVSTPTEQAPVILYQGALNAGRGIEAMLEAMPLLPGVQLWIAGEGDLSAELRARAAALRLGERVRFWGYVKPADLKQLTAKAWLGLNLLEARGLSYYYSLANKFFDTVQAGVPLLCMDFPEYRNLNRQFEVAVLLPAADPGSIAAAIRQLVENPSAYERLRAQCLEARKHWNWQEEKKALLGIWEKVAQN